MNNPQIIIKTADKGGGVVILNKTDYLKESHLILSDNTYYLPLSENPLCDHQTTYMNLINKAYENTILNKKERDFLINKDPTIPIFYYLAKIHKSVTLPPGRPIIAGINSLTSNLSQYVDHNLQKYVTKLPSYLKDITNMVQITQDLSWSPSYKWATLDVTSLYWNIPHSKGIESIKKYLLEDFTIPTIQKEFILDSIRFILEHNIFCFNDQLYIQTRGTAMGTCFAPSYANLYMGNYEDQYILSEHPCQSSIIL